MEYFDDHYVALTEATVAAANNPSVFDGVQDLIISMRWLSGVEGCLFTCSCLAY